MSKVLKHIGKIGDVVYSMAAPSWLVPGETRTGGEDSPLFHIQETTIRSRSVTSNMSTASGGTGLHLARLTVFNESDMDPKDESLWFNSLFRRSCPNIARSFCQFFGVPEKYAAQAWMCRPEARNGLVIVNRTDRWKSKNRSEVWNRILEEHKPSAFVGTDEEFDIFKQDVGITLDRIPVSNAFELAEILGRCDRLLCNQSSTLAIAHGLGIPVTVEVCDDIEDCIFLRSNANYPNADDATKEKRGVRCE